MERSSRQSQKRGRIVSLFKRKDPQPVQATPPAATATQAYDDKQRATERYVEATQFLRDTVQAHKTQWGSFDYPELTGEPEDFQDSQFKAKLNAILELRKEHAKDKTPWEKCGHVIECVFTALSPFATNFLTIAKERSSVSVLNPYGLLCGGLFILISVLPATVAKLIQIAETEIARKKELGDTLDYISQQFEHLAVVGSLQDIQRCQRNFLINRALDVRSASFLYLAVTIRQISSRFGIPGRIIRVFLSGEEKNPKIYFERCIESYHKALLALLTNLAVRISIDVGEVMNGIADLNVKQQDVEEDKFIVPYRRNDQFIGRQNFLELLKGKLMAEVPNRVNHRVALFGMGGVGKTQCALEYAYSNKRNYERIYWICAMNQASILSGYRTIATGAKLPTGLQNATPQDTAEAVLRWLRQSPSWLIILDNLDNVEAANGLVPEVGPGKHLLITTRNPRTKGIPAEPLEVPVMTTSESVELLLTLSEVGDQVSPGSHEARQAGEIVKELGYLPLAIGQSAAYIREVTQGFAAYVEEYHKNRKELNGWKTHNSCYPETLERTLLMSFKALGPRHPSFQLLRILSFLNPDIILIDFLIAGSKAFDDPLQQVLASQTETAKSLLELEKLSLIKWNRASKSLSIHRLVQAVIQDDIPEDESKAISKIVIDICSCAFPEYKFELLGRCRLFENQVVGPISRLTSILSPSSMWLHLRVGNFLCEEGKYKDSARCLMQAKEIVTKTGEVDDYIMTVIDHALSLFYRQQGRLTDAAKLEEQISETRRRILGDEHPETLRSMSHLALIYTRQGHLTDASKLQEKVWDRQRRISGEEDPETLRTMNSLAWTYCRQGRLKKAAELQEQVLKKQRRILGEDYPDTLTSMNHLALTYRQQGHLVKAVQLQEQVLDKQRRLLGEEHPTTLRAMNDLAATYSEQGRLTEAAQLHERVLEERKRILGEEHPETLASINDLAPTYGRQGRLADAARLQMYVLEKWRTSSGEEHPSTLSCINNLALTYRQQGHLTDAARLHKHVLGKWRTNLGEEHPNTLISLNNLAATYSDQGNLLEAAHLYEQALEKRRRTLGEHPDTLMTMNDLALTYHRQGRVMDAVQLHEQTLKKRKTILGEEHPDTLTSMTNLALAYSQQDCLRVESTRLLEEVLEKQRRILSEGHPDTLMSMHNLACAYKIQRSLTEALKLEEEASRKLRNILGKKHPNTILAIKSLAALYRDLRNGEEAAALERELAELDQGNSDQQSESLSQFLCSL